MKVLITSQGKGMDSPVDSRFARAKYFVIADTETGGYEVISNEKNANALQGAGVQAGRQALDLGVKAVITGHLGPKAFATLLAADIDMYINASGTVSDALKAFQEGKLTQAKRPDVEGHW